MKSRRRTAETSDLIQSQASEILCYWKAVGIKDKGKVH